MTHHNVAGQSCGAIDHAALSKMLSSVGPLQLTVHRIDNAAAKAQPSPLPPSKRSAGQPRPSAAAAAAAAKLMVSFDTTPPPLPSTGEASIIGYDTSTGEALYDSMGANGAQDMSAADFGIDETAEEAAAQEQAQPVYTTAKQVRKTKKADRANAAAAVPALPPRSNTATGRPSLHDLRDSAPAAWAARQAALARKSSSTSGGDDHPPWLWSDDNPATCAATVLRGKVGTFLIRPSTKPGHLTFLVNDGGGLRKIGISRKKSDFIMIGQTFPSLYDLVAHFKASPFKARGGGPLLIVPPGGARSMSLSSTASLDSEL